MPRKFWMMLALTGVTALMGACSGGGDDDDDDDTLALPEVDCETATVPAFADVTIWPKCTSCHASTLTGSARFGAPEGIDFDSYASAKTNAEMAAHEVFEGAMPLGGSATEEEKQSLYAWALCGTPEN